MPRTFKATVTLIVTLIVLGLLTILTAWQSDSTEDRVVELQNSVSELQNSVSQIRGKLESGVAVSGGGGGGESGDGGVQADGLYSSVEDPDNFLERPTEPLFPEDAQNGGTVRRRMSAGIKGFNFIVENAVNVRNLQYHVHHQFARRDFNKPDRWVPGIAHKIEISDDYKTYTIHLREDVYWQKPNVDTSKEKFEWLEKDRELTAEDCVFSFRMAMNPKVQAGHIRNYMQDIESVEKVDKYTCRVNWAKKTHQSLPTTLSWWPMPKWLYTREKDGSKISEDSVPVEFNNHWAGRHPVGVGPYQLVDWDQSKEVVLQKFDNYWGPEPPVDKIRFRVVKKARPAFLQLKANKLDFSSLNPPLYKNEIQDAGPDSPFKKGDLEYEVVDRFAYSYIGWNSDKPLFSSVKVRKAMTHALNRKGLIENVYHGLGVVQTGPFYYKHPAYDEEIEPYSFDLDKARKLLNEAGWKDDDGNGVREKTIDGETREFKFTMLAYNKPTTRSWLSVYKEDLRKIGVIMNPSPVDWPTMQKKMNDKKFDAYTGGWGLGWAIDPYQIWHSSQADIPKGSNRVGFRNDRADEIIEKLRASFDRQERLELAHEFHELIHEKQPYTFFRAPQTPYAWNPRLNNVVFQKIRPQAFTLPWWVPKEGRLQK